MTRAGSRGRFDSGRPPEMPLENLKTERSLSAPCLDTWGAAPRAAAGSCGKIDRVLEVFRKGVRTRVFFGALCAALCGYFVWGALTSQQGLLAYLQMRKTLERLREENLAHLRRNGQMEKEIYLLRHSPAYQEKVAREEFGYIREGEVLFWFSDPSRKSEPGPFLSDSVASEDAPRP